MKWKPFIFITIHRRENTQKKERFLVIYNAIKKLIEDWVYVCFLGLYASEFAIDNYWLRKDIEELKYKIINNITSDVNQTTETTIEEIKNIIT